MSDRPHVYVSHRTATTDAHAGRSPNRYIPEVMVEVRVYAPALYPRDMLRDRLRDAANEAALKIELIGNHDHVWPIDDQDEGQEQAADTVSIDTRGAVLRWVMPETTTDEWIEALSAVLGPPQKVYP